MSMESVSYTHLTAETGHFYTTDKNKRNMPEKMEIKKFDPVAVSYTHLSSFAIRKICFFSSVESMKFSPVEPPTYKPSICILSM